MSYPNPPNTYPNPPPPPYKSQQPVITSQPGMPPPPPGAPVQWMELPPPMEGCPLGLEYLTQIDALVVNQHVSLMEAFTGWEVANKYLISNGVGQQVYYAFEESDCCQRQCCGSYRGYTMHIVDNFQREVIRITRPFKCCQCGCFANFDSCGSETTIEAPPGQVIAVVRERFGCCSTNFTVRDASESKDIFRIAGPNMCTWTYNCNCCADKVFEIVSPDGNQPIGAIRKKWRGFAVEAFTNADVFSVHFPLDLDVKMKAALLGATFLIDFLCFEYNNKNNSS